MTMTAAQTTEIYAVDAQFNNILAILCAVSGSATCDLQLETDFAKQNKNVSFDCGAILYCYMH